MYRGVWSWLPGHDPGVAGFLAAGRGSRAARRSLVGVAADGVADAAAGWFEVGGPLPAELCLPAGRQPFDIDAERVHAVTLLSAAAFEVLRRTGSVGPTPELVPVAGDLNGFAAAYDWMRWQMALHVDGYMGGFPMWVWARIRRGDLVGNLKAQAAGGAWSVAVTLSIPRERLLLTDYLAWHDVLNGSPGLPERCLGCTRRFCDDEGCLDGWYDGWSEAWAARVPRDAQHVRLAWWDWPVELQSELFDTWGPCATSGEGGPCRAASSGSRPAGSPRLRSR